MLQTFLITLREGGELLLMLWSLSWLLRRVGRAELNAWSHGGVVAGLILVTLIVLTFPLLPHPGWLDAALQLAFGLSLALVSVGSMASASRIDGHARSALEDQLEAPRARWLVFGFAAFATSREVAEVALFIRYARVTDPTDLWMGGLMGLVACGLLAVAWRSLQLRHSMLWVFRLSALLLFLMSALMTVAGAGALLLYLAGPDHAVSFEEVLGPFLPGGAWYWPLCLLMLTIPIWLGLRDWWRQAR